MIKRVEKNEVNAKSNDQPIGNSFRTETQGSVTKLERIFAAAPDSYLILSPDLFIEMATDAYLTANLIQREEIKGRYFFDLFPENPAAPEIKAIQNLRDSLQQVIATKKPHQLYLQPFYLRSSKKNKDQRITHFYTIHNSPVLNEDGMVEYIIHKVEASPSPEFTENQLIESEQMNQVQVEHALEESTIHLAEEHQRLKEAQQKLIASENLLKTAEEVGQIGSYEVDLNTNAFRFSDGLFRLFGEAPQSFIPTLDFIDSRSNPEDAIIVRQILDQAAVDKKPYYYTRRIKRSDGEWRKLESHGVVICNEEGNAVQFIGLVQDITNRNKTAETIHQMLNGSLAGICLLDATRDETGEINDFIFKGLNKAAEKVNGIPIAETLNKGLYEFFPDYKALSLDKYRQVIETGEPIQFEQYFPNNGNGNWFDVSVVKNGDGIIQTFLDITKRKKAEQQLLEQSHYLRRITETVPDMISVIELSTMKAHFLNKEAFVANGFEIKAMSTKSAQDRAAMIHPDDRESLSAYFQNFRVASDEETVTAEYRAQNSAGEWKWFQVRGKVFQRDSAGNVTHILNAIDNISYRKKAEQEILRLKDEITQKATDKYLQLFNSIDEGFYQGEVIFDENNQPVDIFYLEENPAAVRLIGRSFAGKTLKEINPNYEGYWFQIWGEVALTGESKRMQQYSAPDQKWFDFYISKVGDEASRQVAVVFQDITELTRTQQELQQNKDLLQSVFDVSYNGLSVLKSVRDDKGELVDMEYLLANKVTQQINQLTNFKGKLYSKLHAGFKGTDYFEVIKRVVETGEPHQFQLRYNFEHLDNWFNITTVKLNDGAVISFEDITQVKKAEIALRESEERKDFLLKLSDAINPLSNPVEIMKATTRLLGTYLDADRCIYGSILMVEEQEYFNVEVNYLKPGLEPFTGMFPTEAFGLIVQDLRQGKIVNVVDVRSDWRINEAERSSCQAIGVRAFCIVPVIKANLFVAFLVTHHLEPRTCAPNQLALMEETAERTWSALEKARTEEALKESEERFRFYVTASSDIVYKMSADWTLMYNLEGKNFMADTNKASNIWIEKYIPEHEKPRMKKAIQEAIQNKHIFELEHQVFDVHGDLAWTHSRAVPKLDENGEIIEWIGAASDITKRKNAEEALRQSEERLKQELSDTKQLQLISSSLIKEDNVQAIYEQIVAAAMAIMRSDMGSLQMLSPETNELLLLAWKGFNPESAKFWKWVNLESASTCGEALSTGERIIVPDVDTCEFMAGTEDLDSYHLSGIQAVQSTPLISRFGKVVGMISNHWCKVHSPSERELGLLDVLARQATDLIERIHAQEQLREREEQFRRAIEEAPIPVIMHAEDGEVLQISRTWTELTGFTLQDAPNFDMWLRTAYGEGTESVRSHMHDLFKGNQRIPNIEFPILTRNKEIRHWNFSASSPGTLKDGRRFIVGMAVDITERKMAEHQLRNFNALLEQQVAQRTQALKVSKERFEAAINVSPVVLSILKSIRNEQGEITDFYFEWVSKSGEAMVGKNVTEQRLKEQFPYLWQIGVFEQFVQTAQTGEATDYEYLYQADGLNMWVRWKAVQLENGLFVSVEDITERKKAETTIKENRDRLQSIFDTTLLGMSILQPVRKENGEIIDFKIEFANKELERETGRTALVGKLYTQEFPGIKPTGLFNLMVQVLKTGQPGQTEYFYSHEGFNKWYAAMFVKLGDGLVASNLDITERKQAEAELVKNLTLLQQSEELAGLGSWEYNLITKEFKWSEGMYRLFGLKPGSSVSLKTYLDFVVEEDRPKAGNILRNLRQQPTSFEETLRINSDGTVQTVKVKGIPVKDDAGKPVKMLGLDLNITEIKNLEEENLTLRLQQQKNLLLAILEAQEEERKRISESLHNGVGQILYATKLNLDSLSTQVPKELIQNTEELLKEAISETRRVSHELVPIVLKDFGLAKALKDLCNRYERSSLHFNCDIDVEDSLESYLEIAIYRINQELFTNVVKHAQASEVDLLLVQEEGEIILKVRDNGQGIPQEPDESKGIGLRTISDRVKLLNGTFSITKPATGKGTQVTITIPV